MKSIQNIQTKDLIIQVLREQILSGNLKAGEELAQEDVAQQLGVSRMPIREAMQALVQEGLLTRMPNRHVCVSHIDGKQLREIFRIMAVVEFEILEMLEPQSREIVSHDLDVIIEKNTDEAAGRELELGYHKKIGRLIKNPYLEQMLLKLQEGYLSYIILKGSVNWEQKRKILGKLREALSETNLGILKEVVLKYFEIYAECLIQTMKQ